MCRFSNSLFGLKPLCAAVPSERSVRVAIIGLGYVGLPLAAAVAATGANVVGLDIDAERVNTVNAGQSPLRGREPGLAALVKGQVSKGRLRASLDPSAASGADVIAVCVETLIDPTTHDPTYKALKTALVGGDPPDGLDHGGSREDRGERVLGRAARLRERGGLDQRGARRGRVPRPRSRQHLPVPDDARPRGGRRRPLHSQRPLVARVSGGPVEAGVDSDRSRGE